MAAKQCPTILSQLLDTSIVVIVALIIYPLMDGISNTEPNTSDVSRGVNHCSIWI